MPDLRSSIDEALLRVMTVNSSQNDAANNCSYLDLTVKHDAQDEASSLAPLESLQQNVQHVANMHAQSSQYNPLVCLVSHMPSSSINQADLAEADQSMENDATNNENADNSPERGDLIPDNGISNEGAAAGIEFALPDLAKVTTNSNCEVDFIDTDL